MKDKIIKDTDFKLIVRALKYIKPYKLRFFFAFICILSSIIFALLEPLVWAKLLTCLFAKNYTGAITNILYISVLYLGEQGMNFLRSHLFTSLSEGIVYDLKCNMYDQIMSLPVKAFDEIRVGDFISRLNGDASTIANILTNQFLNTIVDVLKVIVIGGVVFRISIPLSAVIVVCFPFSYLLFKMFGKVIRQKNKEIAKVNDNYFSNIQQSILGIREVKSLGIKKVMVTSFLYLAQEMKSRTIKLTKLSTLAQTLSQCVTFMSQITVMALGGYLVFINSLSIEYFIAFTSYSTQFSASLFNITKLNSSIQQVLTSLERIFGVMDGMRYTKEKFGTTSMKGIKGNIKFENVYFEYNENVPVLKGITFDILHNSKVAIVGSSGSGKTTLYNLLLRFYSATSGRITIDGIEIEDFDEESIRANISIVRQDPYLFNLSVRDNLLLSNPSATDENISKACRLAHIHEHIMNLPRGYSSIIGENGVNFSGGQKQRLAIARALIKESSIILFDEATSALDNESEYYIKNAIEAIAKERTVIIIAHRLSTIIEADSIIVIDNGKVTGQGKHSTLIHKNDVYKRLYETELNVLTGKKEVVSY